MRARVVIWGALVLLPLAGCHKAQPPDEGQQVNMQEPVTPAEGPPAPTDLPQANSAPVPPDNLAAAIPDEDAQAAKDRQVQEDAEATGMTSRLKPDEGAADQPAGGSATNQQ